jgi:hypothetical protein
VGRCRRLRVHVGHQHLAGEARQLARDRATHPAGPDDRHRAAVERLAVEGRPPAREAAGSNETVGSADMPPQADREPDRQLGRGLGEQIGHDAHPHAAPGTGLDVEIVIALERTGHHAQPGAALEEGLVDAVGHEGHQSLRVGRHREQRFAWQGFIGIVRSHFAGAREQGQRFGKGAVGDHGNRTRHGVFLGEYGRRSFAPIAVTGIGSGRV